MSFVGLSCGCRLVDSRATATFTATAEDRSSRTQRRDGKGFGLLFIIGALDTATRMGYLLFLPFLLHARGGTRRSSVWASRCSSSAVRSARRPAAGSAQHLGVVWSVIATEAATALLMIATLMLPLAPMLADLPLLGDRPQRHLVGIVRDRPGPCAKRRHRPWIRAVLYGRHRRRRACADRLRRDRRSFQSDRRYDGGRSDCARHHTAGSGAPARPGKQCTVHHRNKDNAPENEPAVFQDGRCKTSRQWRGKLRPAPFL